MGAALLFIPRELWKRWRERVVDRLDEAMRRRVSRFGRRYREFMLGSLRFIDLKGLATVGFFTPELDEVFVDVSLAYRAPHEIPADLLAKLPPDVTDRHLITDFLDRPQPMVLAVIGAPGSGKTTLLRHTARAIARGRRRVPVLLYLRDHIDAIVSDASISLPNLIRGTLGRYALDEPPHWFEQQLQDGTCVVLLDGLDEVARQEDRLKVAGWVERQTRQYPKNDFVITSRPQGYRTAPIDGALVLQVRSFNAEQATRFVRGWYLAAEKRATGTGGEDVRLRAGSAANDLLNRLHAAPNLYDLTINPLLLTMIANVHRHRGALPGSRADLYGEICQVMLGLRQEAKNLPTELSGDKKEALLRGLAFAMMSRRVRDLPRADVIAEIKPAVRRLSTGLSEEDFLTDVSSNGLLIERESGVYSFAHLTFQEYLAATHIRDKSLVQILADSVDDIWWRETTLLYAARSDADPIVTACLDSNSVTALSLAIDCAEQDSEIAPELRTRLDDLLNSELDDPERFRLRAGVLATRHLRHLIRTGDGGLVCARPVSTSIYELFLAATSLPAPDSTYPERASPVTGVRGSDAVSFVHWINNLTSGEPSCRLPNRADISDPAVQRVLGGTSALTVWLEPTGEPGRPELWTPAGSDHPNRIDAGLLARHVHADIERSTPILVCLLLLRSLVTYHDLARDLDPARDLARALDAALNLDRDLDRDLDLDRALTLTRTLTRTLAHDHARALNLDRTLAHALILARTLDHALNLARTLDHTLAGDHTLDHTLALDLVSATVPMGGALAGLSR